MEDNKSAYIASQYKPKPVQPGPPGSGPGSQGNVNTNPVDDWIGSAQDTSVYYGNLPQSQGNINVNVSNPLGGNYQGSPPPVTSPDDNTINITGSGATGGDDTIKSSAYFTPQTNAFGFKPSFGIDNYYKYLMEQQDATGGKFVPNYTETLLANEPAESDFTPVQPKGFDFNPLPGQGEPGIGYQGDNFSFGLNVDPNLNLGNMSINPTATANFQYSFDKGGPVGEPEIDQSGIASLYPTEKPRKPFGATRENVGEQLEAFRNAPVHVDPPNIGFMGEKVPAPLFDRAMKYLESLPPSERAVIEEMFRENIMKKRMQEAEQMQQSQSVPVLDA
jgi:hypothetical protein